MIHIVFLVTILAALPGDIEAEAQVGPTDLPPSDLPLPQSTDGTCVATSTGGGASVSTGCTGSGGGGGGSGGS